MATDDAPLVFRGTRGRPAFDSLIGLAGGDTDTIAAIVGGIVASRTGDAAIPEAWRRATEPLPVVLR
jgi:hypothetical protein